MNKALTLDALRVIDAISRNGSFASAATELYRVPSALSYTIQKLEKELNVTLFDRTGQRATLTAAGHLVLTKGRQILQAADFLETSVREISQGWEQELTIAIDSVIERHLILGVIQAFMALNKQVKINVLEEVLGGTWDALATGRADLIIGILTDIPDPEYSYRFCGELEFSFAVSPDHPVCLLHQPIPTSEIKQFNTIVAADSSRVQQPISVGMLDGNNTITVSSIDWKIDAHTQGLGVGFLPRHRIRHLLERGSLVELTLQSPRPGQSLVVAWKTENSGNALQWFVEHLQQINMTG